MIYHVHDEWLPPSQLHCDELLQEYLASPAYARSTDKIRVTQAKKQAQQEIASPAPPAKRLQITKLNAAPSPAPAASQLPRQHRCWQ